MLVYGSVKDQERANIDGGEVDQTQRREVDPLSKGQDVDGKRGSSDFIPFHPLLQSCTMRNPRVNPVERTRLSQHVGGGFDTWLSFH